jgi:predicted ATPase
LVVLNGSEESFNPSLMPLPARLLIAAWRCCQVLVAGHNTALILMP